MGENERGLMSAGKIINIGFILVFCLKSAVETIS